MLEGGTRRRDTEMRGRLSLHSGRHHFFQQILQGRIVEHRIGQELISISNLCIQLDAQFYPKSWKT